MPPRRSRRNRNKSKSPPKEETPRPLDNIAHVNEEEDLVDPPPDIEAQTPPPQQDLTPINEAEEEAEPPPAAAAQAPLSVVDEEEVKSREGGDESDVLELANTSSSPVCAGKDVDFDDDSLLDNVNLPYTTLQREVIEDIPPPAPQTLERCATADIGDLPPPPSPQTLERCATADTLHMPAVLARAPTGAADDSVAGIANSVCRPVNVVHRDEPIGVSAAARDFPSLTAAVLDATAAEDKKEEEEIKEPSVPAVQPTPGHGTDGVPVLQLNHTLAKRLHAYLMATNTMPLVTEYDRTFAKQFGDALQTYFSKTDSIAHAVALQRQHQRRH